ncbi:putative ATP-dependent RNA helicase DDX31 [Cricetulus griseus]|uniref:ATP-dependent RNA helicase n=1 Tax=Cricetulus griseus TaxID=10029 RepID=G3IFQ3_CRIGR|nr:putative ATP-dependent RNA helicase DDX31 [Cricetulus griseus]
MQQAEATKRKHQVSSGAPPAKRRNEISSLSAKETIDKETPRTFKGSAHKTFPPKTYLDSTGSGRQEKPCIKTSSLFKNNPEIPALHRAVVKQAREQVFSPEAFQELDLHPHLPRPGIRLIGISFFYQQRSDGPYALVLVPTRELALQSFDTVQKLLKSFSYTIRILDLGFEKDITVILNAVNAECQKRQNVLLSATLTEGVTRLADISLHNPVSISVLDKIWDQPNPKEDASTQLDSFAIPESLDQHVVLVPSKLRLVCLAAFILQKCKFEKDQKMIVFFSSCELVEFHYSIFVHTLSCRSGAPTSEQLPSASWPLKFLRLHGNMEQEYSAPSSPAEYIHRIGRTARIGCHGSSLLILAPSEAEYVNSLASHKINVSEIKMEDILAVLTKDDCFKRRQRGAQKSHATGSQEIRERATVLQTVFEDYVHSSERTVSWAKKALQSFIRAYATYPRELKPIFHVRSLHLGHVAKSFGLRDAPRNLSVSTVKKKASLKRPFLNLRLRLQVIS